MYELETVKGCLISDRCHLLNGSWRRPLRDGLEMKQFRELLGLLVNFIPNSSLDTWTCSLGNTSDFSVSSMRHLIQNSSLLSIEDQKPLNSSSLIARLLLSYGNCHCLSTRNSSGNSPSPVKASTEGGRSRDLTT
ncbi:hypothetical protein Tco_1511236 [Tanacetum coccineum]